MTYEYWVDKAKQEGLVVSERDDYIMRRAWNSSQQAERERCARLAGGNWQLQVTGPYAVLKEGVTVGVDTEPIAREIRLSVNL